MKRLAPLTFIVAIASSAQSAPGGPAGSWEGESVCQVPKPCTTEHVIYEITSNDGARFTIKADKVVEGTRQWMGDLSCAWSSADRKLTCPMDGRRPGVWEFALSGDELTGILTQQGANTLIRKVAVRRISGR